MLAFDDSAEMSAIAGIQRANPAFGPSALQRDRMKRAGYLVSRAFFDTAQIERMAHWAAALAMAPEESGRHWVYHEASLIQPDRRVIQRIENFCPFHDGFSRLVERGALRRWVAALMGGPVALFKDKINFKMPGAAGFLPHQDQQAGWSKYAPLFVTAMVSIDPTTVENGCLELAPRPPGAGLMGEEWKPLEGAATTFHPLPTAPGDVIFFDSFVPHGSKPNLTDAARRVLYLTFNLAAHGDQRTRYFADKHAAFPPDIDRDPAHSYVFRV
jgi:ectoine hydroxylase-related dioxygenase (phytanoyl-CoA dioxygenase family)